VIYEAGKDDRWDLVRTWRKCNPALGDFRSLSEMKRLCKLAKQIPRVENDFRRLYLNQHTAATSRWLRQEDWLKCQVDDVDKSGQWFGGADLSAKQDLTSFALTAKNDAEDGYKVLCWNWIPHDTALAHEKSDRVPYLTWHKLGHIEFTPGDRVDQRYVLQRMVDICAEYGVRKVGFDAHNAEWFFQELPRHGIETFDCPQNYRTFNEPSREFESCITSRKIETRRDECLAWQIANVETKPTSDQRLIRPVKSTQHARIDGIVAILMSIALSLAPQEAPDPAIY
jgi:phage terminase large subunit-like protein